MPTLSQARKLIALVCIAVVFLTVITPATSGLLCGVLVDLGPLFGIVISVLTASAGHSDPLPLPLLETIGSRAPPAS